MGALDRQVLQDLATTRLEDAKVLLNKKRYAAAFYLEWYSVECALKACIARTTKQYEFPDKDRVNKSWTHNLEQLKGLTQLAWEETMRSDADLRASWLLISSKWKEDRRYISATKDESLIKAIDDPEHGVLTWLREHW